MTVGKSIAFIILSDFFFIIADRSISVYIFFLSPERAVTYQGSPGQRVTMRGRIR